jgi:hypothetical protein
MIAVRSWYANPFRELRSHYVTRFTTPEDQVDAEPMPHAGDAETDKAPHRGT